SEFEHKLYRSKYMSWYDDSTYYNIHEEILLAYCSMYGVDSSDVELLLVLFCFTCDEIEEMLMDTNLLHEALRDVKYMCGEAMYEECCGVF
ncbi:MAG: glucosamine 6-phosphate synthetase, partial [Ruminococcus sp.]|nr:glucosamine 6-phosphate synthetase [Ruminococcus sp.]